MRLTNRTNRRRGATTVETAIVILIAFLFIFGIFEYCRFMFFLEMAENATREGARFASCNTARNVILGSTADVATVRTKSLPGGMTKYYMYDDSDVASPPSIRGVVNCFMRGRQGDVTSYDIAVFAADAAGTNIGSWKDAQFSNYIAVEITGNYQFMAANLLGFTGTVPIRIRSMMNSEAN